MKREGVCEVTWGTQKRGFVACNLLRNKPVTLNDVGEMLPSGKPNPNYSPTRAFWLQPTFARLVSAAQLFEAALLSAKQRELEEKFISSASWENTPAIRRYAIPELEAMKAILANGVVAPRELWTPPPTWESVRSELERKKPAPSGNNQEIGNPHLPGVDPLHLWVYRQIKLVPARSSHFKTVNEIGRPKATPEELSAQFGTPWTLRVTGPAEWTGSSNSGPSRNGVWDIGSVTQRLEKPIYELAVSNAGKVAIATTHAEFNEIAGGDNGECVGSVHIQWPEKELLPSHLGFENALTLFRSPLALGFTNVKVNVKQQRLSQPTTLKEPKYLRATTTYIDLDGDGADDIAVWNAVNNQFAAGDGPEGSEYNSRLIFVNVNGVWHLLDFDEDDAPCGC
ncbi:MAG TPA: VCBS repeat-containing protein [Azonexus sp.]|nr:VCBS repeat-containing protein [Azonexus sp.]